MNIEGILICICTIAIATLITWHSRNAWGDCFTPVSVFIGVNLGSLGLYHLGLLPFRAVEFKVYLLFVTALVGFAAGCYIANRILPLSWSSRLTDPVDCLVNGNVHSFFRFVAVLSNFGWMLLLARFTQSNSLLDIYALQRNFQAQYLGYLNVIGILGFPAFICAWRYVRSRRLDYLLVAGSIFGLLLSGNKTYLTISVVTSIFVVAVMRPGRLGFRHIVAMGFFGVGFMILYNQFVDVFLTDRFFGSAFPESVRALERPYFYVSGPFAAMSQIVTNPPDQEHWGQLTLHFLWKLLGQGLGILDPIVKTEPRVDIGGRLINVYPLIGSVYWDWGFGGTLLFVFALGALTTGAYNLARNSHQWSLQMVSALLTYGLFISFFLYYYRWNLFFLTTFTMVFGVIPQQFRLSVLSRSTRGEERSMERPV